RGVDGADVVAWPARPGTPRGGRPPGAPGEGRPAAPRGGARPLFAGFDPAGSGRHLQAADHRPGSRRRHVPDGGAGPGGADPRPRPAAASRPAQLTPQVALVTLSRRALSAWWAARSRSGFCAATCSDGAESRKMAISVAAFVLA